MKLKVYSIYDVKTEVYNQPFFMHRDAQATRSVVDLVSDPQSSVSKHPEDYILYRLGEFDDNTGVYDPVTPPCFVMQLSALANQDKQVS